MRKLTKSIVATTGALALLAVSSCGEGGAASNERMAIATGGSGGVFYVLGAGMANIVSDSDEGFPLQAQSTAATEENLRMIQNGEVDFAFAVYDAAVDAFNGEGDYAEEYDNIRLVMPGHNGYIHVMAREDSGLESFSDLEGLRVGVSPGYVGEKLASAMVEPEGMTNEDLETVPLSFEEMGDGLRNNTLDVATVTSGLPGSAVVELNTSIDLSFVSQTPESQEALVEEHPYWIPATIDSDVYGTDEDVLTFAAPYVVVANADVPDEVVYDFVSILYSNPEALESSHAEGANYTLDNPLFDEELLLPLHSGMEQYLEEEGAGE